MSSCCPPEEQKPEEQKPEETGGACCPTTKKSRPDYLLWGSLGGVSVLYLAQLVAPGLVGDVRWVNTMAATSFDLINTMWWSLALSIVFVGILDRIPREMVTSILGRGNNLAGILRATAAGVLLDLCSHGILMVGMKLYERGASLGQVMAFLIASPWNSISLTLILIALIGPGWTVLFIVMSMFIALTAGLMFIGFVNRGVLPENANETDLPADYHFFTEVKASLSGFRPNRAFWTETLKDGFTGSRMVMRWIMFGILLAGAVRAFISADDFANYFGASLGGLGLTLLAATVIEICSEGSTPLAADLVTRAHAPGNGFTFLMAGVATDYTEIMSIKDTTSSWRVALFLPLLTVPQVLIIGWLMNSVG